MMASASLPVTPPHQIQFPSPPIIRPSVIVNSLNDNCKMENGATSTVISSRTTNYHTNYQLLHDHNYAALPPTSTAAYFGIKPIRQKNSSQCGGTTSNSTPACCLSSYSPTSPSSSSANCCYGILRTTLTSSSPTSTKFQLNLQLNVLKCEIERLNEKCLRQQSQLEKLKDEISLKTVQLSEQLERIYVQENRLEEKGDRLVEEIIEKTELQDKLNRFRESVTKLSCGVILLIGELKRDCILNCGAIKKRNGINGKKVVEEDKSSEDNYKWKLVGNELDKISELVQDNLRAWVFVDQVIEEEQVRMMRESLSRNRNREEDEEGDGDEGEGKEAHQIVVQEVEVVEEEKENLSVVSGGDGEEEDEGENNDKWGPEEDEENEEEQMEVLDDEMEEKFEDACSSIGEPGEEDESENESDLKVSEISSQSEQSQKEEVNGQVVSVPMPRGRKNKEPLKFRCSMCPSLSMRFEEIGVVKVHFKEVHKNEHWRNARGCKRCGMVFVGIGQLQKHRLSEHSKSNTKLAIVQDEEEALQGSSSEMKIVKTSDEIPDVPEAPVKLSATSPEPAPTPPCRHQLAKSDYKSVKVVISDVMAGETRKVKDKTINKTKERIARTRRSSSRSRTSSPSPPPPVLRKMTKSTRRNGSNSSLASSSLSGLSHDSSTPPVLDLEVGFELDQEKAEEKEAEPSSPPPQIASIPAPEVQDSITPPLPASSSFPPPEKEQEKDEKKIGHATDLIRRHLGVYCVCGKQFFRQAYLDLHIRLKTKPIRTSKKRRRRTSSASTTKVRQRPVVREKVAVREKPVVRERSVSREKPVLRLVREKLVVREKSVVPKKPVKKEIPTPNAIVNASSTRTRRSSIITAAGPVPGKAPIPSTSASALASSSASTSIPTKKVNTVIVKPKKVKKKVSHGLHPSKPLLCKCGFKAPLMAFVKRHIKFYKPDRKFSCQICHRVFLSVRYLSHHYKTCHKVSQTNELITARGQAGKLMNSYVKIEKLDAALNGHGSSQKNKSSDKTETEDDLSPRQLPWRPIFKKKLKKLRFTKRKERFICPWCQRHFPFYRKLARHLALNMHSGCGGGGIDTGAGTSGKTGGGGGGGGGAMKKMLYGCKPCEKIFYNQVEFLKHKAVFHRCSNSLNKFITVQKEINASVAAAAAAELSNDLSSSDGIKTRRALRRSSKSSSFSLSSNRTAVASTSAQAARLGPGRPPSTKSARKRSFVSKTQRRSSSSSPSRNSKCLCNASDSSSPCNAVRGSKSKNRGKRNFKCSKCQRVFTCPAYLRMHMGEKHNINCVIPKPCQRCGKVFPTASQLKKHAEVAHNKPGRPVKRRQQTPSPRREVAAPSPPGSPVGPHRHMAGGGRKFKCVCGSLFALKKLLFQHIQEKNLAKGKLLRCTLCPKQYVGSVHLKMHMLRTHKIRSVTSKSAKSKIGSELWCQTCGMIFETERKKIWHESRAHKLKKKIK